jgi:hypothetical protein
MHDPVVLSDGHTYERRYIEQWLQEHDTSPVCGGQIAKGCIYPNHALRNAIEEYFQHVFSVHRRAIRSTIQVAGAPKNLNPMANVALLRTVDALMECSILVNADLSTEFVLSRIMDEAKTLLGAEAASVFLVDREAQELFSTVNSTGGELRIPVSAGIAGHVASTGEPVIIDNAYSDSRFNRSVDVRTGFTTRSVLCVPLNTRKDGVIGVVQLVNKTNSAQHDVTEGFTADDLQFLQVFACQAAAAIANSGFLQPEITSSCTEEAFFDIESDKSSEESEKYMVTLTGDTLLECVDDEFDVESVNDSVSEDSEHWADVASVEGVPTSDPWEDIIAIAPTQFLQSTFGLWEMDVGMLSKLTEGRPLSALCVWIFHHVGFIDHFELDPVKVSRFFTRIEQGYNDAVPYHNREHAASVVHMMNALLDLGGIADALAEGVSHHDVMLDWMACIVAAAIHDFEHTGFNNEFLTRTSNPRAILYNDQHVNENHHVAAAFAILRRPEYHFLESLSGNSYRRLRHVVISLVLSTDMADHSGVVDAFKRVNATSETDVPPSQTDKALLTMRIALKCADMGHLSLSWPAHVQWVRRLEQELFTQGDVERREGVRVSFLMDRSKPGVMESQVGFFDFVVLPLFTTLADAFPATRILLDSAKFNYAMWTDLDGRAQ